MPPKTRSQTARQTVATSNTAPPSALESDSHATTQTSHDANPTFLTNDKSWKPRKQVPPDEPPRFTIDLSLPPEQRYLEVCAALRGEMQGLTSLFDEVMAGVAAALSMRVVKLVCRLLLRGVRDTEETRELRGIGAATGVPVYLLVCFNVLLDLFMGCSSGGAAVRGEDEDEEAGGNGGGGSKMVHFRTLDWGMPSLRRVIVQLDFVEREGGPVVASSVTYAGYVGVLTGVRRDFSVSLNFRPCRNGKGRFGSDLRYYWHLLMVLLGRRRSISSELRRMLLPLRASNEGGEAATGPRFWSYSDIVPRTLGNGLFRIGGRQLITTACYLCFSDGNETTVLEKDRATAVVRRSDDFIVVTNNDVGPDADIKAEKESTTEQVEDESHYATALAELVHEARDRKQCAEHNYSNRRAAKARRAGVHAGDAAALKRVLTVEDIAGLVQRYPTTNESTHFACVLDPKQGRVRWCRRWTDPITARWIREHESDTW